MTQKCFTTYFHCGPLKVVAYTTEHKPERLVCCLLNHSSIRVWRGALPKVRARSGSCCKQEKQLLRASSPSSLINSMNIIQLRAQALEKEQCLMVGLGVKKQCVKNMPIHLEHILYCLIQLCIQSVIQVFIIVQTFMQKSPDIKQIGSCFIKV